MKRVLSFLLTAMMIMSCVSITVFAEDGDAPAFALFNAGGWEDSPNAVSGSKVLLTVPGEGAVYYNNGMQIDTTPGLAAGTVAVTVNPGTNRYTASAGGTTYGPVTIYGYTPVNSGVIGANIGKGAGSDSIAGTDAVLLEANPEGITNLIDNDHPFAFKAGTDTVAKHRFSSKMSSKSYYAAALGFYVDGTLAEGEEFRVFMLQNSGNPYLSISVGPQNHLYLRAYGQTGMGDDTGVVITPDVWHDLNVAIAWNIDTIAGIYIDGQLVAKLKIKSTSHQNAGTIPDRCYHYPAKCETGKGYVGNAVSAPVVAKFPIPTSSSSSAATRMGVIRNETLSLPAVSIAAESGENTVSVTANIPAELTGAAVKIFVNGTVANTMASGDNHIILSPSAVENASITAALVDATGTVVVGFLGEPVQSQPITMNLSVQGVEPIMSGFELYDTVGKDFADYPYAVAGNKVLAHPPAVANMDAATQHVAYFSGDTDVTDLVVPGPYDNTVEIPIVSGAKTLCAKVIDNVTDAVYAESNIITLYSQDLSAGTPINSFTTKASAFADVTSNLKADLESTDAAAKAKAEALLAGGRTVYQTKRDAANSGSRIKSFITKTAKDSTGMSTEAFEDVLEISYDFYIDPAFENETTSCYVSVFGLMFSPSSTLGTSGSDIRAGTYFRVKNSDMHLYVSNADTGIEIESGRWYSATYYLDARSDRVDYYLDGVLISKAGSQGVSKLYDLDKYITYPLAPYTYKGDVAGGINEAVYFSNAVLNAERKYSYLPALYVKADDEEDLLTITRQNLTDDTPVYIFNNGVKGDEALYFGDGNTIEIPVYGFAEISVGAVLGDGTIAKGICGEELVSNTAMFTDSTIETAVTSVQFTDTGVTLGLLKSNIPELFRDRSISIITVLADGSINITPFSFTEGATHESVTVPGEGISKVMIWNLGALRALNEPIYRD